MSRIIDWPEALLPIVSGGWYLRSAARGPGPGLNGREQVIGREDRVWYSKITLTQLVGSDDLRAWSVLSDQVRGRTARLRVPVWVPWAAAGQRWLEDAAPAGATILTLTAPDATLQPGQFFSIEDFLYRIEAVTGAKITFNPPLRLSHEADTALEFGAPTILVRLSANDALHASVHYALYTDAIGFELLETFDR